jgi:hypothetical protein
VQAIEEHGTQRELGAQALDVELAAEAAHRDLERMRPTRRVESERLAVEDQLLWVQALHELNDLGNRMPPRR